MLVLVLPDERTILASFETRTASGGYLKDIIQIFVPVLVFVVPTFHAVVALQRELRARRHEPVLQLLTGAPEGVAPRGMLHLSPRVLAVILFVLGTWKAVGANHMLDALQPGPYATLFTMAAYVSTALWFAITIGGLAWYVSARNELKRECAAARQRVANGPN
jgi:hypothetical protein